MQKKINIFKKNFDFEQFNKAKLSFTFVSYIPLNKLHYFKSTDISFNLKEKKILIKQSYIIATWFYYFSFLNKKKNIKFFAMPVKQSKFTLTKAPMAHKNWSKEQYKFQYFLFKITFKSHFVEKKQRSLNDSLLLILLTKKYLNNYETNILFFKNFFFIFSLVEFKFFNYNKFLTK